MLETPRHKLACLYIDSNVDGHQKRLPAGVVSLAKTLCDLVKYCNVYGLGVARNPPAFPINAQGAEVWMQTMSCALDDLGHVGATIERLCTSFQRDAMVISH
jgi:hypothetical protein